ncbi:MAG: tRNA dihydrouridine synthase DusB [Chitinophagales bacterium]|nr:tRNA dihydrouridine synthase DusB [Chitinophagales bacterium]HMY41623.1 tRNA dihydrouridine synthase DusB [Chitinophagales bacterium]HNI02111.1 tRNA dihydrouridine synthase DusB [Chitinophagales bacterium]HNL16520.1 tRNA dihydrouridine synthase DusB [Chitinophagales bacterium]HNM66155.1 tRNA dihydrouridine synthase DusB [Chitinophagales bacterium]
MPKIANIDLGEFPIILAPMEDVSDPPFRYVCKQYGADLMYTEFISSEGLIRNAKKSIQKLDIFDYERPMGIQMFGGEEDAMVQSAKIIEAVQPDLIDINYGCPVNKVVCKMAGAGILQDIPKMIRLTEQVVKATYLPVTVKTRLGWDDNSKNIVEVAERLQDIGIQALSIHGRTRKQMYKGEADWTLIGEVKNNPRMHIPIFGNGDIDSPQKALEYKNKYGVDGIMIGRAAIGSPWIFNQIKAYIFENKLIEQPSIEEKIKTIRTHLQKSVEWKGNVLGILEMRQHYSNYLKGLPNIKPYKAKLVMANEFDEINEILTEIIQEYAGFESVTI